VLLPGGVELLRYTDPQDACERADTESRSYGRAEVVDGLRGPLRRRDGLPATARVVAVYVGGRLV
jgi:hypothetical protein